MTSEHSAAQRTPQLQGRKGLSVLRGKISLSKDDGATPEGRTLVVRTKRWKSFLRPFGRKVVPIADIGASIAEAVPVLGATVKGALDALVKTLKIIELQFQNEESIQQLLRKLKCLDEHLGSNSSSENVDWLRNRLAETEEQVKQLATIRGLDYANIASSIAQCEKDVTFFLGNFSAVGHIETQALVRTGIGSINVTVETGLAALQLELVRQREHAAAAEERLAVLFHRAAALGRPPLPLYITVIDPFGVEHKLLQIPNTYKELGLLILDRYRRNRTMHDLLAGFVDSDCFDVSLDDYRQVMPVGEYNLGALEGDSTLVMSAILRHNVNSGEWAWCPVCWDSITLAGRCTGRILCNTCNRNVQVLPIAKIDDQAPPWETVYGNSRIPFIPSYPLGQEYVKYLQQVLVVPQLSSIVEYAVLTGPENRRIRLTTAIKRYYPFDSAAKATQPISPVPQPIPFNKNELIHYWTPVNVRLGEHQSGLNRATQALGEWVEELLLALIKASEAIEKPKDIDNYVQQLLELEKCLADPPSLERFKWLDRCIVETRRALEILVTTNDLNHFAVSRSIPQHDGIARSFARAFLDRVWGLASSKSMPASGSFEPEQSFSQRPGPINPIVDKLNQYIKLSSLAIREELKRLLGLGVLVECPTCATVIVGVRGDDERVLCHTCSEDVRVRAIPRGLGLFHTPRPNHVDASEPQDRLRSSRSFSAMMCNPWSVNFPKPHQTRYQGSRWALAISHGVNAGVCEDVQ